MPYVLLAIALLFVACTSGSDQRSAPPATPLSVSSAQRGSLREVDAHTLDDAAHITSLVPEGDGDGVAFTFTDPERGIGNGLGFIDRRHGRAQLVWPDSVTNVWWPAPHRLAFTSSPGQGVHVVVDVHADTLMVIADTAPAPPRRQAVTTVAQVDSAYRARAQEYIDSVRLQLSGQPQRGALRYVVTHLLVAPSDSVAAFYVVATDAAGTRFNPYWYVLDIPSGQARPVDSLTARAESMPVQAASWADSTDRFLYAKDKALYEARVAR
jgi:hypothetical protein